ncbi:dna mismatch repair protein [Nannochloropsis oceanica]
MLSQGRTQVIAQVADCFIVIRCDDMLCIWDQHALHERIRVESFLRNVNLPQQQIIRQSMKPFKPLVFPNYPPDDLELLRKPTTRAFLNRFCLDFQLIKTSVLVRTRPIIVEEPLPDVTELLPALLRDLRDIQSRPGADPMQALPPCIRDILSSKACRGAIMFHTKLSRFTCKRLLIEISSTSFPFNCAHGRPSVVPLCLLDHAAGGSPLSSSTTSSLSSSLQQTIEKIERPGRGGQGRNGSKSRSSSCSSMNMPLRFRLGGSSGGHSLLAPHLERLRTKEISN